jgi:hypothetical protein
VVHDAAPAERLSSGGRRTPGRGPAALAAGVLAGLALAASGCGGDERPADQGVGAGTALRLADCEDWNDSAVEERLATVTQLREFAGGPVGETPGRGAILDDDEAYDLLERHCDAEFADAFKLYKIYVRAAAFIGH